MCRLGPDAALPTWATRGALFCVARTGDELSIVCAEQEVPAGVQCAHGWRALKAYGPFAFDETGVLAALVQPLAVAQVGAFVFSTYDTDYILVREGQLDAAVAALRQAGHAVHTP